MHRRFSDIMRRFLALLLLTGSAAAGHAQSNNAIAMHGAPRLAPDFTHFPYVNPDAPKGGRLRLGLLGSFDSLNPMIIKGEKVFGMREWVIEPLMTRSQDEPFTLYPLLAESVDLPADRTSITFHLNPKATFSDGKPVTADDVIFSLQVLREKGIPTIFGTYYKQVKSVERLSERSVRMSLTGDNRELPLNLGLMPVLPKHVFNRETFDQSTLTPLVGSGPYVVGNVDPGRSISYRRNPSYWARDLPFAKGRFNFDEIRYDYYRDGSILLESFKTGQINVRLEDDPTFWAQMSQQKAAKDGRIVLEEMSTGLPAPATGLVFNTRRGVFSDPRIREALILLFDFEWINATLYNGRYKRTQSYFERSALASTGRPADDREMQLLAPFSGKIKPMVMDGTYRVPVSDGLGHNRDNARRALALFEAAGYVLRDGRMVNATTGQRFAFELLLSKSGAERMVLAYLRSLQAMGIDAVLRTIDSAQLIGRTNKFDYDMIWSSWQQSLSPGNEQWGRFGSAAAQAQGSRNYAGIDNPAVDAMITAMMAATNPEEFTSAVRALDRVLVSGDYIVPLFHVPSQWVAHWQPLRHPSTIPLFGYNIDSWWPDQSESQKP